MLLLLLLLCHILAFKRYEYDLCYVLIIEQIAVAVKVYDSSILQNSKVFIINNAIII